MGLKVQFETKHGILLPNAYIKATRPVLEEYIVFSKEGNRIKKYNAHFQLEIYANEQARTEDKMPIEVRDITAVYDIDSEKNIFIQVYDSIKALPEFKDAEDC